MTDRYAKAGGGFLIEEVLPEETFIPEEFNRDHLMIAESAEEFLEREVLPKIEEIEQQNFEVSVDLLKQIGELGLLGADIPEEFGGLGLDKLSSTLITEKISIAGGFGITFGAHVGIGTLPIVFFGNKEQKEKYLPKLATGELIAAYALTEPESGSDALSARTTATLNEAGTHYILRGTKQWITNAGIADVFVAYAKVDGDKFTAFIVERTMPGVDVGPEEKKMGLKGSSTCSLILDSAEVPVDNVLGEIGKGHIIAFNILNIGRFKLAAGCLGGSKRTIGTASTYANERKQFNKPIVSFPLIGRKLAEMTVKTYALESMVYRTAGLMEEKLSELDSASEDNGTLAAKAIAEYALEASVNKIFGSETLDFVVDEAVQIHGGYGYMQEYEVERAYRDSRINRIFEGTNEINRLLIPDMLLRRALKGQIPLLQAAQALEKELVSLMPPTFSGNEPDLEEQQWILKATKKIFLTVGGLAVQKYQTALEGEQEILANLADMITKIYALESALLRTLKLKDEEDQELHKLREAAVKVYAEWTITEIDQLARETLSRMEEGDTLRTLIALTRKLTRRSSVDTVTLLREIADATGNQQKYIF